MNFQEFLESKKACQDAQEWAKDKTIEQAIDQCHRGDWLLWLAQSLKVDRRLLVGAAGHCGNTVRHLMDERIRNCVDVYIAYGNGEATEKELALAEDLDWAEDAARAASWSADVAQAAADEGSQNQKQTADICREHLKKAIIENWNQNQTR